MNNWTNKREDILNVEAPTLGGRYGYIPHSVFLNEIGEELYKQNKSIVEERYLTANNNKIITGSFQISDNTDTEMKPSITFTNSVNKMRKAEIRLSGTILICKNGMMGTIENGYYARKHIGDKALPEFRGHIKLAIAGLDAEFERIKINRDEMKNIEINSKIRAQLVGDMLINESLINATQLSILQKEIEFSKDFKGNSLWDFTNHVTESFKENHPMYYDKQHAKFFSYIGDKFSLTGSRGLYGSKLETIDFVNYEREI